MFCFSGLQSFDSASSGALDCSCMLSIILYLLFLTDSCNVNHEGLMNAVHLLNAGISDCYVFLDLSYGG